jgi:hypothetical protein
MGNFRNLLVMEEDSALWVARATPRAWLEHGRKITVKRAPTYFGMLAYEIVSDLDHGRILARHADRADRHRPWRRWLLISLRQARTTAVTSPAESGVGRTQQPGRVAGNGAKERTITRRHLLLRPGGSVPGQVRPFEPKRGRDRTPTREIRIRRVLGAKRRDITTQFLVETVVLAISGGLADVFVAKFDSDGKLVDPAPLLAWS